ncbi:hypothetical protein RY831_23420 [Noviherbaspirillum sp. CPCC 100848]|uniref:Uncharacterized protein n=1 Tax=Noviherbaspirillum album TaxID=3080276 RepID=A0ABU6JF90_9BURK|nr:hypothetical protein [Noviherbaspirillum sp. CPCC 100848]MEC4722121.1 hypothetical protein [Noviherbaspirillum sp. CPCC 100848]
MEYDAAMTLPPAVDVPGLDPTTEWHCLFRNSASWQNFNELHGLVPAQKRNLGEIPLSAGFSGFLASSFHSFPEKVHACLYAD